MELIFIHGAPAVGKFTAVETPDDLALALRGAGKSDAWQALTAGKQRGMLYQINSAKRAETRARRIAKLIDEL